MHDCLVKTVFYIVHSLLLINGFNKTEAAVFSCRLCFMRAFPFISLILRTTAGVKCLYGGCKKSPRTTSLCSHIFWSSGIMEFRSCARGRQWCGIIHYYWWTASIKPELLFSRASWGRSLSSVYYYTETSNHCQQQQQQLNNYLY